MEPPLLCHQCSMKFNTINQLSKHRDKFCVGSFSQRIPKDNVYLLPDQRLADEKIRQLQALKEVNFRRSEASRDQERQLLNQSRGELPPHQSNTYQSLDDRYGSAVPIDIVQQLVSDLQRPHAYRLRDLQDRYGNYIPVNVVRQLLHDKPRSDKRGINYEVIKLDEDHNETIRDLRQSREGLQQSSNELEDRLSNLRRQNERINSSVLSGYIHDPSDDFNHQAIEDLRNQVTMLRRQLDNQRYQSPSQQIQTLQPQPGNSNHPTFQPQPASSSNPTFNFSGGSLVAEISALRQYYLNTGGHDPVMVQQLTDMLKESEGLSNKSNTNTVAPYRAPKAVPQSASQLTEQLYAMESENYRLQSELIRMEENPRSSDRTNQQLQLHRDHQRRLEELEHEIQKARRRQAQPPQAADTYRAPPVYYHKLDEIPSRNYSPGEGFTCFYDCVMGLESSARCCKLVIGLYNKVAELGEPSALPIIDTEMTEKGNTAMIGARQPVPRCPSSPDLGLVVELQTSDSTPDQLRTRAWLKLDLFDLNGNLRSGAWKLPFYLPPIRPDMSAGKLASCPLYPHTELYIRVVNQRDTPDQSLVSINPGNHIDYQLPSSNYPTEPVYSKW